MLGQPFKASHNATSDRTIQALQILDSGSKQANLERSHHFRSICFTTCSSEMPRSSAATARC